MNFIIFICNSWEKLWCCFIGCRYRASSIWFPWIPVGTNHFQLSPGFIRCHWFIWNMAVSSQSCDIGNLSIYIYFNFSNFNNRYWPIAMLWWLFLLFCANYFMDCLSIQEYSLLKFLFNFFVLLASIFIFLTWMHN